jgi:hypothetical protein
VPTIRVEITARTVETAAAMATKRADGVNIWADTKAHYLLIRQRAGSADWLVKTRGKTRVIGDIRDWRHDFCASSQWLDQLGRRRVLQLCCMCARLRGHSTGFLIC